MKVDVKKLIEMLREHLKSSDDPNLMHTVSVVDKKTFIEIYAALARADALEQIVEQELGVLRQARKGMVSSGIFEKGMVEHADSRISFLEEVLNWRT